MKKEIASRVMRVMWNILRADEFENGWFHGKSRALKLAHKAVKAREVMKHGWGEVIYETKDGRIVKRCGTLNASLIPADCVPDNGGYSNKANAWKMQKYYDKDAGAWRAFSVFRLESVSKA